MDRFLRGRLDLAEYLASNVTAGAHYADVVLIITAVLSACASIRWPGKGIDKKRFIELLVKHSPVEYHTSWISIPSLINAGFIKEDDTPYKGGNAARIFRGEEIDLCIEDVIKRYPNVPREELRKHCYASLIYEWLRCGYAHEYCPHVNITHVPASREDARVSYIGRSLGNKRKKMVSFHLEYSFQIARHHTTILPSREAQRPETWWIEMDSNEIR